MSTEHAIANVLITTVSGALLTRLYFREYKELLTHRMRAKLFTLRDTLFQHAVAGRVPFNSHAYAELRERINASIRVAEQINLIEVSVVHELSTRRPDMQAANTAFHQRWAEALELLDAPAKDVVVGLKRQHDEILVRKLVFSSLGAATLAVLFVAVRELVIRTPRQIAQMRRPDLEFWATRLPHQTAT